jgi:regulator of protease activity HflC (stomatin/prohibitin superfamily)
MEMQAEAERRKRAEVLQSEGSRQSEINLAEGRKQAAILQATGEAESIRLKAKATADGLSLVAASLADGGKDAAALRIAEQWVGAWEKIAKESSTLVIPANPSDAAGMVAQGLSVFNKLSKVPGTINSTHVGAIKTEPKSLDEIL